MKIQKEQYTLIVEETVGVHESARQLHWHREMEINLILSGRGKYLINGAVYDFAKGDVFLINNDEIHLAFDDEDLVVQVTMFDPMILWSGGAYLMDYEYLRPFYETGIRYSNKLDSKNPHIKDVVCILKEMRQEYEKKTEGWQLMIKSMILKMMTMIIRYFRKENDRVKTNKIYPGDIKRLQYSFDFIEQNLTKKINLSELASVSEMSMSYFSYLFKLYSGTSPMDYILRKRISYSMELLDNSEEKIIDISAKCGFSSLSNFNRCFKKYTGTTPSQFRKS